MSKYWTNRITKLTDKAIEEIEEELIVIYKNTYKRIERDMKNLLEHIEKDENIIVSDLYAYDRYYKLIVQIKNELKSLGSKEEMILDERFNKYAEDVQKEIDLSLSMPVIVDKEAAKYIVKTIWTNDGKNYSSRIWEDKSKLIPVLTQGLVDVIANGGSIHETILNVEAFVNKECKSSYYVAKRLVRTEISHIQNQMALDRYKKAGITQYKYFTLNDDKVCEKCQDLNWRIFDISEAETGINLPPTHPNCRCFISPVVK